MRTAPTAPLPAPPVLRAEIEALLEAGCVLWLPAGIGNPDHAHVRDALLPLARTLPAARVRVYADLPYAGADRIVHADEVRLDDAAFARKLAAVRCHASQLSLLQETWPDLLARAGPLACERSWALADPVAGVILQE